MRLELVAAALIVRDDRILLVWHKKLMEWLPPGGHIEPNETPDDAAKREALEETGLEIEIRDSQPRAPIDGVTRNLPTPFLIDVHSVGDHEHCCLYYLAKLTNPNQAVKLNRNEVENYRWFAESDLKPQVPSDVQQISRLALKHQVMA